MVRIQLPPAPTDKPAPDALLPRAATTSLPLASYSHLGCYVDQTSRLLSGTFTTWARNRPEFCCSWCQNVIEVYRVCAMENGHDCWCDTAINTEEALSLPSTSCAEACPGDSGSTCGGVWAIDVYVMTKDSGPASLMTTDSLTAASVPGYSYAGCFTDYTDRVLAEAYTEVSRNDPKYCCEWCIQNEPSYTYCGVEAGQGCLCGTAQREELSAAATECSFTCDGAPGAQCGGVERVNIYKATGPATPSTNSGVVATTLHPSNPTTADSSSAAPAATHTEAAGHSQGGGHLSGGAIAGIAVAAAVVAIGALVAGLWFCRRRVAGLLASKAGAADPVGAMAEAPEWSHKSGPYQVALERPSELYSDASNPAELRS